MIKEIYIDRVGKDIIIAEKNRDLLKIKGIFTVTFQLNKKSLVINILGTTIVIKEFYITDIEVDSGDISMVIKKVAFEELYKKIKEALEKDYIVFEQKFK